MGVLDWEGLQCEPSKWGCWTGRGCSVSLASGGAGLGGAAM